MLDQQHVYQVLDKFRKRVITEARKNLTRLKKNASSDLYGSLDSELDVNPRSFSLQFFMADYGKFVDEGVSGKNKKYNTPYEYTTKMPPPRVFDKWMIRKGIVPRDKGGKFAKRSIDSVGFKKSLSFLIARSIFYNGMKPSLFFTKPFEREFLKIDNELLEAFGLDIDEFLEQTLNA